MGENEKNGGPAFPLMNEVVTHDGYGISRHSGMTLRDYFAAKALQGLFACPKKIGDYENIDGIQYVSMAYELADLMLAERSKEK